MTKLSKNQIQGIILLISALLIFLPIPFIEGKTIGALAVVAIGIWNLFR